MTALPATIVMASGNAGKLGEIARLLARLEIQVTAQSDFGVQDADETGASFAENSLLKARHACEATGLPAIADDSGLVVDALNGAPGIFSARYAGAGASDNANIDKLLLQMASVSNRTAAFHCVATLALPDDDEPVVATGVWRGSVLAGRRGSAGFGYDPVFLDPVSGRSAAELSAAEKNARSHRGAAIRALIAAIERRFA